MGKGHRAKMDEDLEAWCTHKREQYTLHSVHHGHCHHCVHSVCVCSCRCVHTCVPACLCRRAPMRRSEVSIRYLPCPFSALFLETRAVWNSFIQLDWLSRELQESPGLTHQPWNYRRATVCPAFLGGCGCGPEFLCSLLQHLPAEPSPQPLLLPTWYYASVPQEPKHEKGKQDKI